MDITAAKETIAKAATDVDRLRALLDASKEFYRSNPKQAEKWAREALKLAKKLKDAEAESRAHYNIGCTLFEMSSLADAAKEFETAAALDRPAEFADPLLDRPLIALGTTLSIQGKHAEAAGYFERALKISRLHHRKTEIDILTAIGNSALEQADYPRALDMQYQALELLDKHDEPLRRSVVLSNIGWIYFEIKHLDKADAFLSRAFSLAIAQSDYAGLASIAMNQGLVAKERSNRSEALKFFRESLEFAKRVERKEIVSYVENAMGSLALDEAEYNDALKHFKVASEIAQDLNLRTVLCSALIGYGRASIGVKQYEQSIRILTQALSLSEEANLLALETDASNALAKAFEKSKKLDDAISYFNRFASLNQRLNNQQRQRELVEIAARVEIEKADRERDRLEKLVQDAESRADILRVETERQSKQLTTLALQLVEKNRFLCDLKEELEPQLRSSKQAKIVSQKIDDHIRSDRDWETFQNQFNAVHRDFLSKLSAKYPALTPTELKIATMIKLNLPSKAIANLFCLSARTVENHRLSIRKKLGLSGDANLVSFFTGFGGDHDTP